MLWGRKGKLSALFTKQGLSHERYALILNCHAVFWVFAFVNMVFSSAKWEDKGRRVSAFVNRIMNIMDIFSDPVFLDNLMVVNFVKILYYILVI